MPSAPRLITLPVSVSPAEIWPQRYDLSAHHWLETHGPSFPYHGASAASAARRSDISFAASLASSAALVANSKTLPTPARPNPVRSSTRAPPDCRPSRYRTVPVAPWTAVAPSAIVPHVRPPMIVSLVTIAHTVAPTAITPAMSCTAGSAELTTSVV